MDFFDMIVDSIRQYPYYQQAVLLICGVTSGYLLHIVIFKLRIYRLRKQSRSRNIVVIQPRGKKDGTNSYFEYIKNAQYQRRSPNK